jgi:hypothetical protein
MMQDQVAASVRTHRTPRLPTPSAFRLGGLVLGAVLALCSGGARAQPSVDVFGGVLTDNPWEEVVVLPWKIKYQKPGLLGISVSHPFGDSHVSRFGTVSFAIEGQLVHHFNLQSHWEANLPVNARLVFESRLLGLIDGVAAGIGPSYASRPPSFERKRGEGDAERTLVFWHLEMNRNLAGFPGSSLFTRLHHRSDGYGVAGRGGSSNAIVVGFRRKF